MEPKTNVEDLLDLFELNHSKGDLVKILNAELSIHARVEKVDRKNKKIFMSNNMVIELKNIKIKNVSTDIYRHIRISTECNEYVFNDID